LYLCDLFHILLLQLQTYGSMECMYVCMYVCMYACMLCFQTKEIWFWNCSFRGLSPLAFSDSEFLKLWLNLDILIGLLGRGTDPSEGHNTEKRRHISMPRAGFEPMIYSVQAVQDIRALGGAASAACWCRNYLLNVNTYFQAWQLETYVVSVALGVEFQTCGASSQPASLQKALVSTQGPILSKGNWMGMTGIKGILNILLTIRLHVVSKYKNVWSFTSTPAIRFSKNGVIQMHGLTQSSKGKRNLETHTYIHTHTHTHTHTHMRINYITPWSRVVLEKLIICQLIKNFSAFFVTRKFIIVFTRVRH
jgi:hypothetical protein